MKNFINYSFNEAYISFPNIVNKVKRFIQKILGNNNFKLININVKESKNVNNKIIDDDDILTIFTSLDNCNNTPIYIIFALLVIYWFTIRIIQGLYNRYIL